MTVVVVSCRRSWFLTLNQLEVMAGDSAPVDPSSFYPSPRTEARRSLDGLSQVSSPVPSMTLAEAGISGQPTAPEATVSTYAAPESIITESEAEPIYIDGNAVVDDNADDASSDDAVLTDEDETPHVGLPLPIEHIYVQDPRQPLLLSDFQVLKTLGTLL